MIRVLTTSLILAAGLGAQTAIPPDRLLQQYCAGCHNDKLKSGGLSVSGLRASGVAAAAGSWEKILRKVRTGEMPPPKVPRPAGSAAREFVAWLEENLDRAAASSPNPGSPAIHRLNRAEYANAVRDLLALEMDHAATLPADDSGYGFDNIGDVLTVSPLLFEKYMSAGRRVAQYALGTAKLKPALEKYTASSWEAITSGDGLPLGSRGMEVRRFFPMDAEYSILVRIRGNPAASMPAPKLDIRVDGLRVELTDIRINNIEEGQQTRNYETRVKLTAGMHTVGASVLDEGTKVEGAPPPPRPGQFGAPAPPTPAGVDYVTIGGPFDPKGPGDTESRRRVLLCSPANTGEEMPCARRILSAIARRAYRRPVADADVLPLMGLFEQGRKDGGSFEAGIEMALRAVLVSPGFLFRVERPAAGAPPGTAHRVSELELASRLSFFLWSSVPDEDLLAAAEKGRLRKGLADQVTRMLREEKSRALVENFAGQWLHLRNIPNWRPDPDRFPQFDNSLRSALEEETRRFFEYIVREDRPVTDFIAADYSFVNERLARHYGMKGVRGAYFRKVTLPEGERAGVLTHGSLLTVTSYPTRTSPVVRGKWILENILGSPPPAPPPDVPDLADSAAISAKDLRAALEKHRESAACAACHARLDPMGFALENFDATGRYRKEEGGAEIDASSSLPGGEPFSGPDGLKRVLLERQDDFVECLAEKMLTYALGRGLQYSDMPAVRQVRRETARGHYRFSALVNAVVNSVPFQMRRVPSQ
jgi:mono/diheme cytochrome c family protein